MATEISVGPLGEVSTAGATGGGTALSTSAARIMLPPGTKNIELIPRNFSAAVVAQWLKCPWLAVVKTTDGGLTFTDYSFEAQDASTATSVILSSLDTLANGDALYVGSYVPFAGVAIDVDAANGNASVLTVNYRKSDNTWATISATDNTASGGVTMAQDGSVTWTIPTDWTTARLQDTDADTRQIGLYGEMFWTQWVFGAALDSSTTLDSMIALPRSTVYAELPSGFAHEEAVTVGTGGISAIQAKTDAGTANLIVNVSARGRFG